MNSHDLDHVILLFIFGILRLLRAADGFLVLRAARADCEKAATLATLLLLSIAPIPTSTHSFGLWSYFLFFTVTSSRSALSAS